MKLKLSMLIWPHISFTHTVCSDEYVRNSILDVNEGVMAMHQETKLSLSPHSLGGIGTRMFTQYLSIL